MPKDKVPTEGQVKRAVARGQAAINEAEQSLTELRELAMILSNARDEATGRLAQLLQGNPVGVAQSPNISAGRARF